LATPATKAQLSYPVPSLVATQCIHGEGCRLCRTPPTRGYPAHDLADRSAAALCGTAGRLPGQGWP